MIFAEEVKLYGIACGHYVISQIPKYLDLIDNVIFFGSSAQRRGAENSDIDLFFDTKVSRKKAGTIKSAIKKAVSDFRLSKEALKFKMAEVSNEISFFVGNLDEWADLKRSILSTGIVLYGKYSSQQPKAGLKYNIIIIWEVVGTKRGGFLNKMYGYKSGSKKYKGFIEKSGGLRIGKSAAMIPIKHKDEAFKIIEGYGFPYRVIEVFN